MSIFDKVREEREAQVVAAVVASVKLGFALASLACAVYALINHDTAYAVVSVSFAITAKH